MSKRLVALLISVVAVISIFAYLNLKPLQQKQEQENYEDTEFQQLEIVNVKRSEYSSLEITVRNNNPKPDTSYIPERLRIYTNKFIVYDQNETCIAEKRLSEKYVYPKEEISISISLYYQRFPESSPEKLEVGMRIQVSAKTDEGKEVLSQMWILTEADFFLEEWLAILRVYFKGTFNKTIEIQTENVGNTTSTIVAMRVSSESVEWTISKNPIPAKEQAVITIHYTWTSGTPYDIEVESDIGNIYPYRATAP